MDLRLINTNWLIDWLIDRLIDWLIDRLIDWVWLIDRYSVCHDQSGHSARGVLTHCVHVIRIKHGKTIIFIHLLIELYPIIPVVMTWSSGHQTGKPASGIFSVSIYSIKLQPLCAKSGSSAFTEFVIVFFFISKVSEGRGINWSTRRKPPTANPLIGVTYMY